MKKLDNEKDLFIKEKLQKDKLISKKADDIINNFIKGNFKMNEEKSELSQEQTNTTNVNTETTKQEETTKKPKKNWSKKLLATAASLIIVFCAANVYASTQGYDNIFFMIKYLITGEQVTIEGKDNLLSDRDITISYEPINITEGLSVTIKKLQIKDNEARLFVMVNEKETLDNNTIPLRYKIYNSQNDILCNQTSEGEEEPGVVIDELVLKNYKEEYTMLKLEIYKVNSELIATLNIDLENRTVEVVGEEEALSKISEIELKEFLRYASILSKPLGTNRTREEYKIATAISWDSEKSKIDGDLLKSRNTYGYKVEEVNKLLESFCGEGVYNFTEGKLFVKIKENGTDYFIYNEPTGEVFEGECIDITNISYCNGVYTVTYTYYYKGNEPDGDIDINSYNIYQQTIFIRLNEDTEYSKFKVVSMDEAVIIKSAENNENAEEVNKENNENTNTNQGNTTNNTTNNINNTDTNQTNNNTQSNINTEKIDNYATSMSWTEYWAPGIKFQYPTDFELTEVGGYYRGNRQGETSTIISGVALGINPDTKETIKSNVEIQIHEPKYIGGITAEEYYYRVTGRSAEGVGYITTNSGLKWYSYSEEAEGVRYNVWTHYNNLGWGYVIKLIDRNPDEHNWKIVNMANWILGSTKLTSY